MTSRRAFVKNVLAVSQFLALGNPQSPFATESQKRLRVLVLGGTGFIGPHFVKAALLQGHEVAVFSRGTTENHLPDSVERLTGDRNGDLNSIKNRDWDAVIDTAAYVPSWVRTLGEALKDRVGHYTFVSTHAVYDHPSRNALATEDSRLVQYEWTVDPYTLTRLERFEQYGALKLLCEQEAERQFFGKTLVLRPCQIYGPGGFSLSLFWMDRIELGGEMMVASTLSSPVQFIDIRDIAEWVILMLGKGGVGIYNTVGPKLPITLSEMSASISHLVNSSINFESVSPAWLEQKSEDTWKPLLFWENTCVDLMRMSAERAFSAGLKIRPMERTFVDSLEWHKRQSAEQRQRVFLGAKQTDGANMTWSTYLKREKATLVEWHVQNGLPSHR